MKLTIENINQNNNTTIRDCIESDSKIVDNIVDDIVSPYCKDLDAYVSFIKGCLKDGETPPTDLELEDFCLNLSTYLYFAGGMCEYLGIRDDISKLVYKEAYHANRSKLDKGTVADKDSIAELKSQSESLINVCYNRAFKIMRSKVDNAQELLSSCKKVLSRRMQEYSLTQQMGGN